MKRSTRSGLVAAALTTVMTAALVAVPATAAQAAAKTCSISTNGRYCQTQPPHLQAVRGAILITAWPPNIPGASVTCSAYDSITGALVGSVTSPFGITRDKLIGGLTNSYYLFCVRSATGWPGGGGGRIEN
ncbi:hypothetical protein [Spirillospora sp. NPDC047279]|uniref:hypothetical protein n=1 Tax=Spirillospora sp. NPDC047279 TaxID=3155478 RepID=UPI00341080F7